MNYIPQYHQQFVRIYNLIKKTIGKDYSLEFGQPLKTMFGYIELISAFMISKDKEGEWVLKEASRENPELHSKKFDNYNEFLQAFKNNTPIKASYTEIKNDAIPETFRDLFRTNCIPANNSEIDQDQIENLKLIKW